MVQSTLVGGEQVYVPAGATSDMNSPLSIIGYTSYNKQSLTIWLINY